MFITKQLYQNQDDTFDWNEFFSDKTDPGSFSDFTASEVVQNIRGFLKENNFEFGFTFNKVMTQLLDSFSLGNNSRIIELGAGTGFLTRYLVEKYKATGVLVDKCQEAYNKFLLVNRNMEDRISYILSDIFELKTDERFDIVCSFGLIEHFQDKKGILDVHKNLLKEGGCLIILVPLDTPLTRCFYEAFPELNLGYRELLSVKELENIITLNNLKIIKSVCSQGYKYDFVACLSK